MSNHVMVTLILEVVFRAFTYGVHATFITLLFPSENFGFLYGVSFLIGGLTGFLAIPLFDMSMGTLSGINSKPLVNQDVHSAYCMRHTVRAIRTWTIRGSQWLIQNYAKGNFDAINVFFLVLLGVRNHIRTSFTLRIFDDVIDLDTSK